MKFIKVFAVFVVLHLIGWFGAHWFKKDNPQHVLLVADTSFALKPEYPAMQRWIESFTADNRYRKISIGTDKARIGDFDQIKSIDSIFRASFGRSTPDSLKRYATTDADQKIFLSDGEFDPSGWTLVRFP